MGAEPDDDATAPGRSRVSGRIIHDLFLAARELWFLLEKRAVMRPFLVDRLAGGIRRLAGGIRRLAGGSGGSRAAVGVAVGGARGPSWERWTTG